MTTASDQVDWQLSGWDSPAVLDHAGLLRTDPQTIARLWRAPTSRLLSIDDMGRFDAAPFGSPVDSGPHEIPEESTIFLGLLDQVAWFARRGGVEGHTTLRDPQLSPAQRQLAGSAVAVLNWYRNNRYCAVCGGPLRRTKGGYAAVCTRCERETFPRTDPAIICGVLDPDERLYLAHQSSWEKGRVSILAGFVEAGESAEQAVHREVFEEAQLHLHELEYLGSQPWPMPRSLMFSYLARSQDSGHVDENELAWGGWYTRAQVVHQVAEGSLALPAGSSVGHRIIADWLDGRLPGSHEA